MQYSSATAQQVGIDFDHLAAYIGTVSSTTRLSAETIGQSMKTISARMTAIKDMKTFDSEGENINNVEKALRGVGVSLRDSNGGFRDMQDVLGDLSERWSDFSKEDQMFIAQQIGGVRQQNIVISLLSNRAEIQKQLTAEINSTGLAEERYGVYLKGVEAAQERMNVSWEALASSSVTTDLISDFYDATAGVLDFINSVGGIPTVLKVVIPLLVLFNLELLKTKSIAIGGNIVGLGTSLVGFGRDLTAAISLMKAGTSATTALNLAFGTTAVTVGAVALALASVVAVIYTYNEQVTKTQEAGLEETANQWSKIFGEVISNGGDATDILNKYKEGVDAINKAHEEGGLIADIFVDKQAMVDEGLKNTVTALVGTSKSYDDYIEKVKEAAKVAGYKVDTKGLYKDTRFGKEYAEGLGIPTEEQVQKIIDEANSAFQGFGEQVDLTEVNETGQEAAEALYAGFSETLKSLGESSSIIDDLIGKSNKGELGFEDAAKIPEEYLSALTVEGDKLKINIDLLKEKQIEEARTALEAVTAAQASGDATSQQVAVIQLAYDQLMASSQNTFGAFNQTAWQYDSLLWQIANDANAAGFQFMDMEGKALTSAQSIFEYMSQGDAQFNSVIQQIAQATGRSVAEVMNVVNQMIAQSVENARASVAQIQAMTSGGLSSAIISSVSGGGSTGLGLSSNQIGGALFGGYTPPSYSGGGGGGGGGSNANNEAAQEANDEAERLREIEQDIADARREAIDDLKDQLSIYKDIIDARKDALDIEADERQYNQDVEDKNKEILNIQTQLNALQFDDSEEANARRLALQDELSNLTQELEDIQYDQSIEEQKQALDAEYEAFQNQINNAIRAIEDISAESVGGFASQLAAILAGVSVPEARTFHDGASKGVVGQSTNVRSGEVFAKLMSGEVVSNSSQIDNFMKNTLPQMIQSSSVVNGGNISNSIPITIMGNVDKDVMPKLEDVINAAVKQMNNNMKNRGYTRRAESFGN